MPLLGATLIAILAFFPIFMSPDTTGEYVRDLFIVSGGVVVVELGVGLDADSDPRGLFLESEAK